MKSLMTLMGILAFNFSLSAQASEFSCPVSTAVANYACSGTVKVTTLAELNAYKNNLGVVTKKPTIAKNLQIAFNPNLTADLIISTPCTIKIPANVVMNSTANICLHGTKGVTIDDNFKFNGKNLKLESKEEVIIDKRSNITASDIKLLSIGSGDTSKAYLREDAVIRAANLTIESFDKGFLGKDSDVILTGALGVYTLGDDEASIRQGAKVEAQKIEVSSTYETRVANFAKLTAEQVILNGKTCNIHKTATITSTDRLGNCFLTSLTKAKFTIDKNQGVNPLTVNFNAKTIADAKSFIWSFGDGETVKTLAPTISHVYTRTGSFTAILQYATKDNYKGLKSAGAVQIDVKAPPVVVPTTPPSGTFNYIQDGTFVYLSAFIKRTQFDIANAYYVFDDNENNKLYLSNAYQNSKSSAELYTYGVHKITLYVEDARGQKYNTTIYADLKQNDGQIAPYIRFYGEQSAARTAFINMSSSFIPVQDQILQYFTVDFGDGQVVLVHGQTSITHTYAQAGTYNVKISSEHRHNVGTATVAVTVTDENKPAINPVAWFDYHILGFAGNVTFADDRSGTPNGQIISYEWNFGDGQGPVYGQYASHFFTPGDYLVSLTVTDTAGLRSTQTQKVHIETEGDSLVTALGCWEEKTKTLDCNIFALDKANQITRVKVDWGDGTSNVFTEAGIQEWGLYFGEHVYQDYGTYHLKLTVDTARGQTKFGYAEQTFVPSVPVAKIECITKRLVVNCNTNGSYDPKGSSLTFEFNFGDGYIDYNNTKWWSQHDYTKAGNFAVTVKVTNLSGQSAVATAQVNIISPGAVLSCYTNNLLVSCDALGSYDASGSPLDFTFDYGDSTIDTNSSGISSHAYATAGLFTVKLKVKNANGMEAVTQTQVQTVAPENALPRAWLTCHSDAPYTLRCDGKDSTDSDGTIVSYKYIWDDNTSETHATNSEIFHIFNNGGNHQVTLIVTDNDGGVQSATNSYNVQMNNSPVAVIHCYNIGAQKVHCDSNSYEFDKDDTIAEYIWNLGDGNAPVTTMIPSIEYFYGSFGTYNVSLQVKDLFGATASISQDITLQENKAPIANPVCVITVGSTYQCSSNAYDEDGQIVEAAWTIGGQTFNVLNVLYDFTNGGDYNITFTAKDNLGKVTVSTTVIRITDKPQLAFQCLKIAPLTASCSINLPDPNAKKIVAYKIDFGDGDLAFSQTSEHTFNDFKQYEITASAVDVEGHISSFKKTIVFDPIYMPPQAKFHYETKLGFRTFFDSSDSKGQDRKVLKYHWVFGDGQSLETTLDNVQHNYAAEGYYNISLVVTDMQGAQNTFNARIYIYDPEVSDYDSSEDSDLLGIDTDRDNIRDDVQVWINLELKDNIAAKAIVKKLAQNYTQEFLDISDNSKIKILFKKQEIIGLCLSSIIQDKIEYKKIIGNLRLMTFNTDLRVKASMAVSRAAVGTVSEGSDAELSPEQYCIGL